ncbi:MAG: hypothetical protein ABI639_01505 [Thermoanaerobaculia bacterium]
MIVRPLRMARAFGRLVNGAACAAILTTLVQPTAASATAAAAGVEGAAFTFQPVPLYGADVRSLIFDPVRPDRAFAGTSAGHVYVTDDGGATFRNAGAEIPFPGWVVGTLIFDDNRPDRLWAGLWGIWGGGMIAFSDDAAATWTLRRIHREDNAQVYVLATVPGAPDRLLVGTRAGVEISADAGVTFRAVGRDLAGLIHVSSLHVDPQRPAIIVAGTWRRAYRSEDGGESWQGIFDGMILDTEVFSLHAASERPGELWASTCGWIYRGDELGTKWNRFTSGLTEKRTPSFAVLPGERLLAGTVAGAFLSTDRGASFRRTTSDALAVLAIAFHPARPDRILLGTEGSGIWSSSDGGETFRPRPVAMRNLRIPALDVEGEHLFAAVANAGPASGVYRSPDGGSSFEPVPAALPTVLAMAKAGGRLFVATESGLFERVRLSPGGVKSASGQPGDADRPSQFARIPELGERRVEQVAVGPDRIVARTRDQLFELPTAKPGARFRALAQKIPGLRSIAIAGGTLWVLRDNGLFRFANGKLVATSTPYPPAAGTELLAVDDELLYSGKGGLARREIASGAWLPLRAGAVETHATGSGRFPLVVESAGVLALYDRTHRTWMTIDPPYPARETLSAVISGGKLLLGSSGFGMWQSQLPSELPTKAATLAASQRSASSDSKILR